MRLQLLALVLLSALTTTQSCSSRLDERDAASLAEWGASLYSREFSRRAPVLDPGRLAEVVGQVHVVAPFASGPALPAPTRLHFVNADGPTDDLAAVEALCDGWWLHAIGERPKECDALGGQVQALEKWSAAYDAGLQDAGLTEGELSLLAERLQALPPQQLMDEGGVISDDTLVAVMFGADGQPALLAAERLDFGALQARTDRIAEAMAEIESSARSVVLTFAWRLRGRHVAELWRTDKAWMDWLEALAVREEKRSDGDHSDLRFSPPVDWPASEADAVTAFLERVTTSLDSQPLGGLIDWLTPKRGQYDKLLEAHRRYRAIADGGGFVRVPKAKLRRGKPNPVAAILRRRLSQEAFASSGTGDVFTDPDAAALAAFQRAHQLADKGRLDTATRRELNVPATERVRRIRGALAAWQATAFRPDYYVEINIPSFYGEVWRAGALQHRFRVVVGNRTRKRVKGKRTYVNATPVTTAAIDRVVYNPYWNIPSRILTGEVLPDEMSAADATEREAWLDARGYEVMAGGTKWEWVRQRPGPGNALGQVKIIFPNPYETYLHDTASKKLFKRPVRSYSHGCVRVHRPLELAQLLLDNDGQYDEAEVRRLLARRENRQIFLHHKVRIFLEYVLVRVDEAGVVHFFNDIYERSKG